MTKLDFKRILI